MLPWIIAAAAQILASKQKEERAKQALYLDQLKQNAHELGGNTRMADVISGEKSINDQGVDYGAALQLVGRKFGGGDDATSDNDGAGQGFEWTNDPFNPRRRK